MGGAQGRVLDCADGRMMSDYEPPSGFNLPPGCFENDPRAPWNEPDPWVGHACGECRHCRECAMLDGSKTLVCTLDWLEEVDPTRQAEECFEP